MRYVCVSLLVSAMALSAAGAQGTETLYLSGTDKDHTVDWDFYCASGRNSRVWTRIPVPSNWELQGFGAYNYGLDEEKSDEKGQYRRVFTPPASWRGRRILIVFEGSMTDTEVSINGKPAGPIHQGGFYRFEYEVTDLVECGAPNQLSVVVSKQSSDPSVNAAERSGDYWVFGGIYRPVYLEAVPREFIRRVAINARADGSMGADVYVARRDAADRVVGQIRTLDGKNVGAPFEEKLEPDQDVVRIWTKIPDARLWTAETPNLYELEVRLRAGRADLHVISEKFGFRTMELRPGEGIFINGRPIKLKGVNRHSFWPDSGRTTSRDLSFMDVNLIKDMNMNAVRMSHYPPDTHFLEACDTLGLYVLDELAGWQRKYDTGVGEKLVEELVTRDVNHPCVIFWDNGNEGGWNTELDDDFGKYDPQRRPVIHPWEIFNHTDTAHYRAYDCCPGRLFQGDEVFFPTEFLHGLYDGGAGAGLEDYWNLILSKPLGAGGFIWALLDEAVKRTDKGGVLDADGNHGPDGILGPYREKEASFFTIKELWSPVWIKMTELPADFSGTIEVENRYDFTSLVDCRFSFELIKFPMSNDPSAGYKTVYEGKVTSPVTGPWTTGTLQLDLPYDWYTQDALMLTARNQTGREIYTWSWMIQSPKTLATRAVTRQAPGLPVIAEEDQASVTLRSSHAEVRVSKESGFLASVKGYSLANGPALAAGAASLSEVNHYQDGKDYVVEARYQGAMRTVKWRLQSNGWLRLDYEYELRGEYDYFGVNFDYPEEKIKGMRWLGKGPYRVWKNRLRGGSFNVWQKPYNDTSTGETWLYPEFKGYHANTYWAAIDTAEGPITVVSADGVFLRMLTPRVAQAPLKAVSAFPTGAISFLQAIAPIGTKFHTPSELGPQGAMNQASGVYRGTLFFYFGRLPAGS